MKKYPAFSLGKSSGSKEAKHALDALPGLVLTTSVAGILPKLVKP
jgi:hypothetical protein